MRALRERAHADSVPMGGADSVAASAMAAGAAAAGTGGASAAAASRLPPPWPGVRVVEGGEAQRAREAGVPRPHTRAAATQAARGEQRPLTAGTDRPAPPQERLQYLHTQQFLKQLGQELGSLGIAGLQRRAAADGVVVYL
eukprot:COSAG01_NODE_7217_length_3302_cov_2.154543_2_plen_141_part_00